MRALIDNDVLLKGSCFGLLRRLVGRSPAETGVLSACRYVLPRKIRRLRTGEAANAAVVELTEYLDLAAELEPTERESRLAAELEFRAQVAGLDLDVGESQLCAMAVMRAVPALLTGDKRAILGLERLVEHEPRIGAVAGRVYCLEQLFAPLLPTLDVGMVREVVCREPIVDRALANCFSCSGTAARTETVAEGLTSYIESIRAGARRVLAPGFRGIVA